MKKVKVFNIIKKPIYIQGEWLQVGGSREVLFDGRINHLVNNNFLIILEEKEVVEETIKRKIIKNTKEVKQKWHKTQKLGIQKTQ